MSSVVGWWFLQGKREPSGAPPPSPASSSMLVFECMIGGSMPIEFEDFFRTKFLKLAVAMTFRGGGSREVKTFCETLL